MPAAPVTGTARVKRGMAEMLKGGVIMDVVTPEQAKIAEDAGAVAVMALERVPADIRAQGGVARMSDPDMIDEIIDAVSIPVMAKARIGHFVEAQVLQALGVDYVDESEVLTPADYAHHIDKWAFTVPFVCGATNLGEALRRITEGAAMIRSKGEAGTGDVSNATTHMRTDPGRDPRLASLPRRRAVRRGQGAAGAVRAGQGGRRDRQAAGGAVHRGRHRHPGRRGHDDAARRRGRLRRLGHLQVRRPGQAGRRDRQGHHLPRRPGRDREGVARARRGDGRHQRRRHPAAAPARRARLGERPGHRGARPAGRRPRAPVRPGRVRRGRPGRSAGPTSWTTVDGLVIPGGESTTISKLVDEFELLRADRASGSRPACRCTAPAPA